MTRDGCNFNNAVMRDVNGEALKELNELRACRQKS